MIFTNFMDITTIFDKIFGKELKPSSDHFFKKLKERVCKNSFLLEPEYRFFKI